MTNLDIKQKIAENITTLNLQLSWKLSEEDKRSYSAALFEIVGSDYLSDDSLRALIKNYHSDHYQVDALRNPAHPEHNIVWLDVTSLVNRIIVLKTGASMSKDNLFLEDTTQEVLQGIVQGIWKFKYMSRLQTWIYSVVGRVLASCLRVQYTQKRGGFVENTSLEELIESGEVGNDTSRLPEELGLDRSLIALVDRVLGDLPDHRMGLVFHLWVFEQQTLREIGEKLSLSPARVHSLCKQSATALKQHPAVLEWLGIRSGGQLLSEKA